MVQARTSDTTKPIRTWLAETSPHSQPSVSNAYVEAPPASLNAKVAKEGLDFQLFVKTFADKINNKIHIIERGNGMANDHMDKDIVEYDEATIKEHLKMYEDLHEVVVDQILKGSQQDVKPAAESAPEPAPAAESPLAARLLDAIGADEENEAARIANESAKIALDTAATGPSTENLQCG